MADVFDPNDHKVDEVKAYVNEHPDDAARVLEAEKAGQNRTTLVSSLEDGLKSVPVAVEPKPVTVAPSYPGLLDGLEVTPERGYRRKS